MATTVKLYTLATETALSNSNYRGNVFQVKKDIDVTRIFMRSSAAGTNIQIWEVTPTAVAGEFTFTTQIRTGTSAYVSPNTQLAISPAVTLLAGKYYAIIHKYNATSTYYNAAGTANSDNYYVGILNSGYSSTAAPAANTKLGGATANYDYEYNIGFDYTPTNHAPTAPVVTSPTATTYRTSPIDLTASTTDSDGDNVQLQWSYSPDGGMTWYAITTTALVASGTTQTYSWDISTVYNGDYRVRVCGIDSLGVAGAYTTVTGISILLPVNVVYNIASQQILTTSPTVLVDAKTKIVAESGQPTWNTFDTNGRGPAVILDEWNLPYNSFEHPANFVGLVHNFADINTVVTAVADTKQILYRQIGNSSYASDNPKPDTKQVLYRAIGNSSYAYDNNRQTVSAKLVAESGSVDTENRFDSGWNRLLRNRGPYIRTNKNRSPHTMDEVDVSYIEFTPYAAVTTIVDAKQILYRAIGNSTYAADNSPTDTKQILFRQIGNSTFGGDNVRWDVKGKLAAEDNSGLFDENRFDDSRFLTRHMLYTKKLYGPQTFQNFEIGMIAYNPSKPVECVVDTKQILFREVGNSSFAGDNPRPDTKQVLFRQIGNSNYSGDNNKSDVRTKLIAGGRVDGFSENELELVRPIDVLQKSKLFGGFEYGIVRSNNYDEAYLLRVKSGNYTSLVDARLNIVSEGSSSRLPNGFEVAVTDTLFATNRNNSASFNYGVSRYVMNLGNPLVIIGVDAYQKISQTWVYPVDTKQNVIQEGNKPVQTWQGFEYPGIPLLVADHMTSPLYEDEFQTNPVTTNWIRRTNIGGATQQYVTDADGTAYTRFTGYQWYSSQKMYAFDPNKTYRLRVRVRRPQNAETGKNAKFYMGIEGYLADGVTLCNYTGENTYGSQHYFNAAYADPSTDWIEYDAWIKGNAPIGSNGDTSKTTTPTNPGKLHPNVRYFRALFIANYPDSVNAVTDMDWAIVEVVGTPEQGRMNNFDFPSAQVGMAFWGNGTKVSVNTDAKQVLYREVGNSHFAADNTPTDTEQVLFRAIGTSTFTGDNKKQDMQVKTVAESGSTDARNRFDNPLTLLTKSGHESIYVFGAFYSPETFEGREALYIEMAPSRSAFYFVDTKQVLIREIGNSSDTRDNRPSDTKQILYRQIGNSTYTPDNAKWDVRAKTVAAQHVDVIENQFELTTKPVGILQKAKMLGTFEFGVVEDNGSGIVYKLPGGNYQVIADMNLKIVTETSNGRNANRFGIGVPTFLYSKDTVNPGSFNYGLTNVVFPLLNPVVTFGADMYQKISQTWDYRISVRANMIGTGRKPSGNTFDEGHTLARSLYMKGKQYAAPITFEKADPFTLIDPTANSRVTTTVDTKQVLYRGVGNSSLAADNPKWDTKQVIYRAVGNSTFAGDNKKQDVRAKLTDTNTKQLAFEFQEYNADQQVRNTKRYNSTFDRGTSRYMVAPTDGKIVNFFTATLQSISSPIMGGADVKVGMSTRMAYWIDTKQNILQTVSSKTDVRVWLGENRAYVADTRQNLSGKVTTLSATKQTLTATVAYVSDAKQTLSAKHAAITDTKQALSTKATATVDSKQAISARLSSVSDTKQGINRAVTILVDARTKIVSEYNVPDDVNKFNNFGVHALLVDHTKGSNTFERQENKILIAPAGGRKVTTSTDTRMGLTSPGIFLSDTKQSLSDRKTYVVDTTQKLLTTVSTKSDVNIVATAKAQVNGTTKQVVYSPASVLTGTKQVMYIPNVETAITTKQVLYKPTDVRGDTEQIIKATALVMADAKQVLYVPKQTIIDTNAVVTKPTTVNADSKQSLFKPVTTIGSMRQMLSSVYLDSVDVRQNITANAPVLADTKQSVYVQNYTVLADVRVTLVELVAPSIITPTANGSTVNKRPVMHVQSNDYAGKVIQARVRFYSDSTRTTLVHTAMSISFASGATTTVVPTVELPVQTLYATMDVVLAGGTSYGPSSDFQFTIKNAPWSDTVTDSAPGIRAVWLNDLANTINDLRAFRGLALHTFTDGTLVSGVHDVRSLYFAERRTALAEALVTINVTPTWQTASLDATTDKKGILVNELRNALKQG